MLVDLTHRDLIDIGAALGYWQASRAPNADVSALLERLTSKVTPSVIVYVDGGCVQGAKASHDVKFQVLDNDNVKAGDPGEVTLQQYESLPVAAY